MEALERTWDIVTGVMGGLARGFERSITGIFGSSNARYLKKLQPNVARIAEHESRLQVLSDAELREQTEIFRRRLADGQKLELILPEAFAVCREGGRRFLGMRHYDVQMLGGMVLHSGAIAEMITGEGKTLVATLPAYLNALEGKGVHVVTVNDYLARRDMEWMGPLYMGLGLTVGAIQSQMPTSERQKAYDCDITYGTNNEFGFDYLRDNMRHAARGDARFSREHQQCQGRLNYAIIDEVDNILIDEARTPLIIAGSAEDDVTKYSKADVIARKLRKDEHFEVKEKEHTVHLTEAGVRLAEQQAGVESFYTAGNMEWPHLIDNALKAHHLYKLDVNYVIQGNEIVIVDEFTGRLMPGRNWSDGLHQAVEAKEGVKVKEESQTLATITLQNFFKLYRKISGMTGTAMTEAGEFWKIYKLDVIAIPPNRNLQRINYPDVVYRTEKEKYDAIADEIERVHKWDTICLKDGTEKFGKIDKETESEITIAPHNAARKSDRETIPMDKITEIERHGRPVLVGTISIEKSERLSRMLETRGIEHEVLNAKHHQREAEIVSQAGRLGAVTIATNMAGRGTDIILGGNPETMAWAQLQDKYPTRLDVPKEEWDALVREIEEREQMKPQGRKVAELGGLHVLGTERHEARRIDLQLRGRCGRQGDPGSSRFYLSLEDDLMRIFAGDWVKNVLTRLGMQEGEAIVSRMVSRRIEAAQRKVEERHFDTRKNLLEYDEVMDEQRKRVYGERQHVLEGESCKPFIMRLIDRQIDRFLGEFLAKDYGAQCFAAWAGRQFSVEFKPHDFRDTDLEAAERLAKDEAQRQAETQIFEAIEENLPTGGEGDGEDSADWNWEALARFSNTRWHTSLRDRDLKKLGRDNLAEYLIHEAHAAIEKVDCSDGKPFLEPDFAIRQVLSWVRDRFDVRLDPEELKGIESPQVIQLVHDKAREAYEEKEVEYPVVAGMLVAEQKKMDRDQFVAWACERFQAQIPREEITGKQKNEAQAVLVEYSRANHKRGREVAREAAERVARLFRETDDGELTARLAARDGELDALAAWLRDELRTQTTAETIEPMTRAELDRYVQIQVEDHFNPEVRRMERSVVLDFLDTAWKNHLLVMDHLKSSVGLRGYAQVDPKVEYKREGMRTFEAMWDSISENVTRTVFRVKEMPGDFVRSTFVERRAIKDDAQSVSDIAEQQQAAIEGTEVDKKPEPIRNRRPAVGRNDPCPCGSGKKFKQCCMRKGGAGSIAAM